PHSALLRRSAALFLHRSGDPRLLHSFPTRRSSDLVQPAHVLLVAARADHDQSHIAELGFGLRERLDEPVTVLVLPQRGDEQHERDRKSTRLNSSHVKISYAVFCLKKKIHQRAAQTT